MNSEAAWLGSSCMSVSAVAVRMSAGSVVVQSSVGTEHPFQDAHPQLILAGTFSSSPSGPKMGDSREGSKEEATVTFMTHYRKSHTTTSTVFCSFSARHWDHLCWMDQSVLGFTFWGEACQSTCALNCQPPQVLGQGDKPHGWCRQRGWITMTFVCRGDLWRVGGRDVRASGSVLEEAMRPGCHGSGRDGGGSPVCSSPGSVVLRNVPGREHSPKAPLWFRKVACLQALFT